MAELLVSDGDIPTAAGVWTQIDQQLVIQCTSTTRPTGVTGRKIFETDTGRELVYYSGAWVIQSEPFQSWSPTITQGSAVSGTVNLGWYRRSRGKFEAFVKWTASAAGTASNQITVSTPVTLIDLDYAWGDASFVDASPATNIHLRVFPSSTTAIRFIRDGASGAFGSSSITIASGDILRLNLSGRYA